VCVCVFITAVPIAKLFAWGGGGGQWRPCATKDYEPRPVWTSLPITSERGGEGYCVKEGGEKKGSVRGSVQGRCDYTTALDIEVDP
jgi:hypothetical protein